MRGERWLKRMLYAGALASVGLWLPACSHTRAEGTGGGGVSSTSRFERSGQTEDIDMPRRDASPYPDLSTQSPADQGALLPTPGRAYPPSGVQPGVGGAGPVFAPPRVNSAAPVGENETYSRLSRVARPRSGPYIEPWNETVVNPNAIGGAGGAGGQ